jgi:hypothetical protein
MQLDSSFPKHALRYFSGGGGATNVAATPVPAATPPVTENSAEVVQSQQDLRRQNLRKRGFASTVLAGDTGGPGGFFPSVETPSPTNVQNPPGDGSGSSTKLGA